MSIAGSGCAARPVERLIEELRARGGRNDHAHVRHGFAGDDPNARPWIALGHGSDTSATHEMLDDRSTARLRREPPRGRRAGHRAHVRAAVVEDEGHVPDLLRLGGLRRSEDKIPVLGPVVLEPEGADAACEVGPENDEAADVVL